MIKFAEILLPLPLEGTFTYRVPLEMSNRIKIGHRVIVPFGRKKYQTGIVAAFTPLEPTGYEIKDITVILDQDPIVRHPQMKLWEWIAGYYLCSQGEVFKAAVPAGLKIESETFIECNPDYDPEEDEPLSEAEQIAKMALELSGQLTVAELEKKSGLKRIEPMVSRMIERGIFIIAEKIVERYRPKKEYFVVPAFDKNNLADTFASVKGAKKQEQILMTLIEMTGVLKSPEHQKEITKKALLDKSGLSSAILSAIIKKGIARIDVREINRFKFDGNSEGILPKLSEAQNQALFEIEEQWQTHNTVLLHGVTSSGKTEIYSHLIEQCLQRGEQALYLVPEIALTTQLTKRLQRIFGNRILVYHSKFSDNERVDIWKKLLHEPKPIVILGARSSVFLPFSRLGLVIVDEEHESSYKQVDPAPRYNARDTALVLASMHGAKSLLGSATPSVETYYKALSGKFGLVSLTKRFNDRALPHISLIDMTDAQKKKEVRGAMSVKAIAAINNALNENKQAILFRNRRGFAPVARCKQCAWTPKCVHCDVNLTYHNYSRRLECHYCGTTYALPNICPLCGQPTIEVHGYGTERIEEDVEQVFPEYKIARMDLDTTRNKDSYENIIENFSAHKSDILIGTQMVSKGLDFKDVSTVVVLNADEMLNMPDFKSSERAFNMLEQVSGRAGRDNEQSSVLIQTYNADHPILRYLVNHDYQGYYNFEIEERRNFNYPPFTKIIYIYIKHRDAVKLEAFSNKYATRLRDLLGTRVSGPDKPKVARVKSLYIQKIMIKIETDASMNKLRDLLKNTYKEMATDPTIRTATIYYDVDPS